MRGVVRSLAVLMAVGLGTVTLVDAIVPASGDEGVVSVTLMITIVGVAAVGQLLSSVMRSNPEAWHRVPALWSRSSAPRPAKQPPAIVNWDALIVGAITGGERGRDRLARRLEPLDVTPFVEHLPTWEPSADDVLDAITHLLDEADHLHDD